MKSIILFLFLFFTLTIFSQEIEFGEVSKEELKSTRSEIDSTAGAEILYLEKDVHFVSRGTNMYLVTEVFKRIKFYGDGSDDLKNATERIFLYEGDHEFEDVSKIKAYTYNLSNDKIEKTKLDKDQIFEEQYTENREVVSFTMPNVKKGSVIDFKYKITSPYIFQIDELKFQYDIPLKKLNAKIVIPKNMKFNMIPRGESFAKLNKEESYDHRVSIETTNYNYSIENVPPLVEEKYVDNINNYRAGIVFELIAVKYPSGTVKNFSQTWGDVARTLAFHEDYEYEIEKDRIFRDELDSFLANEEDTIQRLNKVLEFAKNHLKWNQKYGKYFSTNVRRAYKEQQGNVADINLTLVSMLRHAGFNAVPIVLSSRNYMRALFPTVNHLNYVIAYVELDNIRYYLDATDEYSELNILPLRVYNYFGLYIDTPNEIWKHVDISQPPSANKIEFISTEIKADGELTGTIKQIDENHYAYLKRKEYYSTSQDDYLRNKEKELGSIEIKDFAIENIDSIGKVTEEFKFSENNRIAKTDNELIFNPLFFKKHKTSPFKAKTRNYPIDFVYPRKDRTVINIKIPDGYKIKEIPESSRVRFGETQGKYEYLISGSDKYIRLSVNFVLNQSKISAQDYDSLKQYFDKIIEIESKQIILEKV